jgi:hypothetical protein
VGPPKPQQLQTLVEKLQQRDKNNIFRDPVTESVVSCRADGCLGSTALSVLY